LTSPTAATLRFLHLSDIHFSRLDDSGKWDLNEELRRALREDAARLCAGIPPLGILVTGDIAASGNAREYELAGEWLQGVATSVGCVEENVWTVPGNHDVDRTIVRSTYAIKTLHRRLRECDLSQLDDELRECFLDEPTAELALLPFTAYNAFAHRSACEVTASDPYWQRDFDLGDDHRLRLRGLNTALISDSLDDDAANKLVLGAAPCRLEREDEPIVYMTMGHHPPSWLRDGEEVRRKLNAAATVQLWGHRHTYGSEVIDGHAFRVEAGATQPYRDDGWDPRYNLIDIALHGAEGDRKLLVRINARAWRPDVSAFDGDNNASKGNPREELLSLGVSRPSAVVGSVPEVDTGVVTAKPDRGRRLAYRFATLPFDVRATILLDLGLITSEEAELPDGQLLKRAFSTASSADRLADLWDQVERRHGTIPPPQENPYRGGP
jgi:hypothetical protein